MKTHHAAGRLPAILAFAALWFCLGLPGLSQGEEDNVLNVEPYRPLSRPVAAFDHEGHQDFVEDCASCHHGRTEDGKRDYEDYDPSESCNTCHKPAGQAEKGATPLPRAYHRQCIGCHKRENTGPTHCAGCHQK